MDNLFSLGDIVSLKCHPYSIDLTGVIVSGDHISLPPLMVVVELFRAKQNILGIAVSSETIKYKCIWFSSRTFRFVDAIVLEADLKIVQRCDSNINKGILKRGDKVALRSAVLELGKKKSALIHEDGSANLGTENTVTNSLLSYLSPIIQVADVKPHQSKHQLYEKKTDKPIRIVSSWDVKCLIFDPSADKISEITLPLEALALISETKEETLNLINQAISGPIYLQTKSVFGDSIVRPRSIVFRGGYYFLRAYDLLINKVIEVGVNEIVGMSGIEDPFVAQFPSFDIEHNPASATAAFIAQELLVAVENALKRQSYIRIKYKNKNEQVSHRTLKNYGSVSV